jgi:hypothetical protein
MSDKKIKKIKKYHRKQVGKWRQDLKKRSTRGLVDVHENNEASKKSIARFNKAIKDKKFKDLDKAMSLSEYFKTPKKKVYSNAYTKKN